MKKLTVAFSKPKEFKIGSAVIRLAEGTNFSHVSLRWYSASIDCDLVYQASHGMVHFVSGARFDQENETVAEYSVEVTDEQFTAITKKCVELAGVKYGTLQIIGMALERVSGIKNPFRDGDKTFVCSELVGEVLKQIMNIDLDLEYAGPGRLERLISSFPTFERCA